MTDEQLMKIRARHDALGYDGSYKVDGWGARQIHDDRNHLLDTLEAERRLERAAKQEDKP